jgi:hypothetical protein
VVYGGLVYNRSHIDVFRMPCRSFQVGCVFPQCGKSYVLDTVEREKRLSDSRHSFSCCAYRRRTACAFSLFGAWKPFNEAEVRLWRPIAAYQIVSLLESWTRRESFIGSMSDLCDG